MASDPQTHVNPYKKQIPGSEMASFQIQQFTRVHDDPCDQQVQNKESAGPGSYSLTNLVPAAGSVYPMAYQQPAVPAAPGYGWSASAIDADSLLRNHAIQTNSPHCPVRSRTQARPFATVPFMGRGKGEVDLESRMIMPMFVRQGKECGTVSDKFYENQFTPQIPYLAQNVQNPVHLIPEVASNGWVRAGIPSRQWVRDQNC